MYNNLYKDIKSAHLYVLKTQPPHSISLKTPPPHPPVTVPNHKHYLPNHKHYFNTISNRN